MRRVAALARSGHKRSVGSIDEAPLAGKETSAMNHKHRKTLHALFAHPEPANLSPIDVEHVLEELGAELKERSGAKFSATLNGHTANFHHAHHSLPKEEVRQIRGFLTTAGIDPVRDFPL
jgi:hypothetical protein